MRAGFDRGDIDAEIFPQSPGEIDVSHSLILIGGPSIEIDRLRVLAETGFETVAQFIDPRLWNASLLAEFDRPDVVARAFAQQTKCFESIEHAVSFRARSRVH